MYSISISQELCSELFFVMALIRRGVIRLLFDTIVSKYHIKNCPQKVRICIRKYKGHISKPLLSGYNYRDQISKNDDNEIDGSDHNLQRYSFNDSKASRYFFSYRVSLKKCTDFTMSYLQKYQIWDLQIFYSNLQWAEIVYWKIWCDYLILFQVC